MFAVVVQSPSRVQLFMTSWTAAHQASLSLTISQSLPKFMSIESVIPSFVTFFSFCLQSSPASGYFPMSWLFASGGQSPGASASASVLPNDYSELISFKIDWFDLLAIPRILTSFLQHHSTKTSILLCLLYSPALTSVHEYWKDDSLDYTDFCWQSDIFAF